MTEFESNFGEPPERPSDSDCCNSGCTPCVFDIYEKQLLQWKNKNPDNKQTSEIRYDLLSETKFCPFVLLDKVKVSSSTWVFQFQPQLDSTKGLPQVISGVLPYASGQHLIMKCGDSYPSEVSTNLGESKTSDLESENISTRTSHIPGRSRSFTTRAYTPITLACEENDCKFSLVIKLYKNGQMSGYIKTLNVGDVSYFRGPCGEFSYITNKYKMALMLCIGTGIAPIYPIVKQILNDDKDETVLKLLYGCRNIDNILLRHQLRDFTSYWNFTSTYYLTEKVENNVSNKFGENFIFNRINELAILKEFKSCSSLNDIMILVCGTKEFTQMIYNVCIQYGIKEECFHIF